MHTQASSKHAQMPIKCINIGSRNARYNLQCSPIDLHNKRNGRLTFLKLLILVFHFTLVIHIFCPLNLNLLFVILNEVSRIFIGTMFGFQQIKLLTML